MLSLYNYMYYGNISFNSATINILTEPRVPYMYMYMYMYSASIITCGFAYAL